MPIRVSLALISISLVMALSSCGGGSSSVITPPSVIQAAAIAIANGNNQSGLVGVTLPEPLVVIVTDSAGRPLAGANVNWTVATGSGTVDVTSSVTDWAGTASTHWAIGTKVCWSDRPNDLIQLQVDRFSVSILGVLN